MIAGAMPTPLTLTTCGLPEALCAIVIDETRLPVAEGVKVNEIAVDAPGASVIGVAGAVSAKSELLAPARVIAEMSRSALPVFFTVTVTGALVVP